MIETRANPLPWILKVCIIILLGACNYPGSTPEGELVDVEQGVEPSVVESDSMTADQSGETHVEPQQIPTNALLPEDFTYQGAFRLPDDFAWGALGMDYYPAGDGGPGSLFVTGFQGLLDGNGEPCYEGSTGCNAYFARVSIPDPGDSTNWEDLPTADFIQEMSIFDGGLVQTVHEAYSFVSDIAYVPPLGSQSTDKIYGSLNEWYPEGSFGDDSF
ncbi:MAG: hypothetical protein PVH60_12790, partial [Anaerolineales bacterium]